MPIIRLTFLNRRGRLVWNCIALVLLTSLLLPSGSIAQVKPNVQQLDSLRRQQIESLRKKSGFSGDSTKPGVIQKKKEAVKDLKNKYLDQFSQKKKSLDSAKKSSKITVNNIGIQNSTLFNTSSSNLQKAQAMNNVSVYGQIQLFKVPLGIDLAKNSTDIKEVNPFKDGLFKMNLDRSQIQNPYKNQYDKFSKFKQTRLNGLEVSDYLKRRISEKVTATALKGFKGFPRLEAVLKDKDQLTALLSLDEEQLKERLDELMSDQQQKGTGKADSLSNEQRRWAQEQTNLKKAEVTEVIVSLKHDMEESGLDQGRLLLIQNFMANKGSVKDLEALFDNEMKLNDRATPFNRAYSKVKKMQAGNFSQEMPGSFLNDDIMVKGISFDLKTLRGPATIGFGMNKDTGMPKDAGFNSSVYDSPKLLTYVSVPVTNFAAGRSKISWIGAFDKQSQGFSQLNAIPKSGLALTVSQELSVKDLGQLTLEVSKSTTQYKNLSVNESDKLVLNQDLKMGNYFREDFLETMSFGVKHRLDLKKLGLSSNTFISYSGLGFQNPAQQGYGNMGMRVGGGVKKSFFKNKIVLNARTDIKNTNISAVSGAHWNNYNFQFDSRFKLTKNTSVNLKYAENGVDKVDHGKLPVYSSQRMQADFTGNYKIGSNYGFSHFSLGKQLMLNPGVLTNTNFLTMIYSQSIALKTVSLSGNAFFNKELKGIKVLGDMFNADLGCQYNVLKNLNVSSAVTFLDNENIARQVGIRNNVQVSLLKNFDVSAFFDLRKNIIDPLYPDLFSTGRGELSIRYYLNK